MYSLARQALTLYFNFAKNKVPFVSAEELIQHYRTHYFKDGSGEFIIHDDFLEEFDKALRIPTNKKDMTTAMKNLAEQTPQGKTASNENFFNALIGAVQSTAFSNAVKAGVKATGTAVTTIAKTAVVGASAYLFIAAAFAGLMFYQSYHNSKK